MVKCVLCHYTVHQLLLNLDSAALGHDLSLHAHLEACRPRIETLQQCPNQLHGMQYCILLINRELVTTLTFLCITSSVKYVPSCLRKRDKKLGSMQFTVMLPVKSCKNLVFIICNYADSASAQNYTVEGFIVNCISGWRRKALSFTVVGCLLQSVANHSTLSSHKKKKVCQTWLLCYVDTSIYRFSY